MDWFLKGKCPENVGVCSVLSQGFLFPNSVNPGTWPIPLHSHVWHGSKSLEPTKKRPAESGSTLDPTRTCSDSKSKMSLLYSKNVQRMVPLSKIFEIATTYSGPDFHVFFLKLPGRSSCQWEFQDPKMEVLYSTIFLAIFWVYIPLHRPYIGIIYGRYLQFRILEWPLIIFRYYFMNILWIVYAYSIVECPIRLQHVSTIIFHNMS